MPNAAEQNEASEKGLAPGAEYPIEGEGFPPGRKEPPEIKQFLQVTLCVSFQSRWQLFFLSSFAILEIFKEQNIMQIQLILSYDSSYFADLPKYNLLRCTYQYKIIFLRLHCTLDLKKDIFREIKKKMQFKIK